VGTLLEEGVANVKPIIGGGGADLKTRNRRSGGAIPRGDRGQRPRPA
jgi:hypothetical protein